MFLPLMMFQSTHPRGVRRSTRFPESCSSTFQSTHPRGVRRRGISSSLTIKGVSIHAPAWGATEPSTRSTSTNTGFNPRTRVGCDTGRAGIWRIAVGFNPRTRVGCDTMDGSRRMEKFVSIHAPAWGATEHANGTDHLIWFQSTHPRGVRR